MVYVYSSRLSVRWLVSRSDFDAWGFLSMCTEDALSAYPNEQSLGVTYALPHKSFVGKRVHVPSFRAALYIRYMALFWTGPGMESF